MRAKTLAWVNIGLITLMVSWFTYAQVIVPYVFWPKVYDMAEDVVVKRGFANTQSENFYYFRIGWGQCLAIGENGIREFMSSVPRNEYINFRDFADGRYRSAWESYDAVNCPRQPHEVKPSWRGTRPLYWVNYIDGQVSLAEKSVYRVTADDNRGLAGCHGYIERSYWSIGWDEDIYHKQTGEFTTQRELNANIPEQEIRWLAGVCRGIDVKPEDHEF